MWRFVSGAKKPGEKRNTTDKEREDQKRARDRNYEQNRRGRKFNVGWKVQFPWLDYDRENNIMFCGWCRKHPEVGATGRGVGNKNAFKDGTDNFRFDSIKCHQRSDFHQNAAAREEAINLPAGTSPAEVMLNRFNQQEMDRMDKLFRSCHAIAKHSRPYSDITWLSHLDEAKGLDVGTTYRNDKQAEKLIHLIAQVERNRLSKNMRKAKFLSVISDGTTDASIQEAEIVYIRFAQQGVITCQFVAVENVDKADARSITAAIMNAVTPLASDEGDETTWLKRLVALGADGAAVMMGEKNGVSAILRKKQPAMQSIHCFAHRLELAYKDGLKSCSLYTSLSSLLLSLYLFYHNSALNRSNLRRTCQALGQSVVVPSRVGGTRWMAHLECAIKNVVSGYQAITTHLGQMQVQTGRPEQIAKAKGMLRQLKRWDMVSFAHFMWDIVLVLKQLLLVAQGRETTIGDVYRVLEASTATLAKYKRTTPKEKGLENQTTFNGQDLTGDRIVRSTKDKVIDGIQEALKNRFVTKEVEVVKATSFASFCMWPAAAEVEDFGDDSVQILTEHYKVVLEEAGVETAEISAEWGFLKTELYSRRLVKKKRLKLRQTVPIS